jgi:hypothetical protein
LHNLLDKQSRQGAMAEPCNHPTKCAKHDEASGSTKLFKIAASYQHKRSKKQTVDRAIPAS